MARAGISTAPFAVQHSGNARIVSVLRFRLALRGSGGKGEAQRNAEGKAQSEVPRRHPQGRAEDQPKGKSAIDHCLTLQICQTLSGFIGRG